MTASYHLFSRLATFHPYDATGIALEKDKDLLALPSTSPQQSTTWLSKNSLLRAPEQTLLFATALPGTIASTGVGGSGGGKCVLMCSLSGEKRGHDL